MELCVHSYGEDNCLKNITSIFWSWLEYEYEYEYEYGGGIIVILETAIWALEPPLSSYSNSIILANRFARFYRKFSIANFHIKARTIHLCI